MILPTFFRSNRGICTAFGAIFLLAQIAIDLPCAAVPSQNSSHKSAGKIESSTSKKSNLTSDKGDSAPRDNLPTKNDSPVPKEDISGTLKDTGITEFSFRSHVYGPCRAHLSKDRARFEWGMIIFLLAPPDYTQLYIVNPGNKCYRKQPMLDFLRQRWGEWKHNPKIENVKKLTEFTGHDLRCTRYSCITDGIECEFSTTQALGINPQLAAACCRFVGLPPGYGIPISATKLYSPKQILKAGHHAVPSRLKPVRGKMVNPWLVVRSIKKSPLTEKDLKLLKEYKMTNEDFALWFSKDGTLKANDLEEFYITGPSKLPAENH